MERSRFRLVPSTQANQNNGVRRLVRRHRERAALRPCNLRMDGVNPLLATKEGLILTRAMLGLKGSAVTAGTGITTPKIYGRSRFYAQH